MKKKKYISEIPNLIKEWDWDANVGLDPTKITHGSHKKAWWKCSKCGHKWRTVIKNRGLGYYGCPECSKIQQRKTLLGTVLKRRGSLAKKNPELANEWHPTKNGNLTPNNVTLGSHKKVWWLCAKCGYEWQMGVKERGLSHQGCPACANRVTIKGVNDLATKFPNIAKEWHPTKNGNLKPEDIIPGSDKKIWWICPKGHEYIQKAIQRTRAKQGCPYCSGRKVLPGFNDLATANPRLASEWHPTKNGNLRPTDVTIGSNKKVWWKCPVGHEYQASICARKKTNCPICNFKRTTSFPEQAIFYYVKKLWPNSLNKYKDCFENTSMEFDIYIPERKIAIEYDGVQWHKSNSQHEREIKKYEFCKKNGIYLIRIKEYFKQSWNDTADKIYNLSPKNIKELEKVIYQLLGSLGNFKHLLKIIDIEKDKNEILNYLSKIDNSLAKMRPDVAEKWNYEKNGNLTPDMFSVSSNEVVWWKCPDCKEEWQTRISCMTRETYGCPECSKIRQGETFRKLIVKKRGSLADKNPELVREWHPTKNGNLTPRDVTLGSHKHVWWLCSKCKHEWQAVVESRGLSHQGCPACSKVKKGNSVAKFHAKRKGSLAEKLPELAQEWHPSKNGNLTPQDVTVGSDKRVWWKCSKCGYEWQAVVRFRIKSLGKCPKCKNRKLCFK